MDDDFTADFDLSSLIGMSSLVNKKETNESMNVKQVEKDLISQLISEEVGSNYSSEVNEEPIVEEDPINEYNELVRKHLSSLDLGDKQTDAKADDAQSVYDEVMSNYGNSNAAQDFTTSSGYGTTQREQTFTTPDSQFNYSSPQNETPFPSFAVANARGCNTEEQLNQRYVDNVLNYQNSSDNYTLLDENTADMKLTLIDRITKLKDELESDGVNTSVFPDVNMSSPLKDIEYVAKLMMLRATRNRNGDLGDEIILSIMKMLSSVFNGKRKIFNMYPDLTNSEDIVKVRLRRVRDDTSQVVSGVMDKIDMSPLMRILIGIVPSVFLHSYQRSIKSTSFNLGDDLDEIRKF